MARMLSAGALGASALICLVACSTPGISYLSRVPAADPLAASYRTVSVGYYAGPEGDWYTAAFETMLLNTDFDGGPWFVVHDPGAPEGTYEGRYSGQIDIIDVDVDEYTKTRKKCVEWDGLFDCEHRAEVLQACIDIDVAVAVTTRLSDVHNGAVVFQQTYHGGAGEHDCDDVEIISGKYAGRRERGYGPFGHFRDRFGGSAGYLTHALVQEALRDTLSAVRRDIAPYTARAKAPLLTEAIDPEVRADPRFAQAVSSARDGALDASCRAWADLMTSYPGAPGVRHNAGACAEASGDYETAQALYAEAMEGLAPHRRDGDAFQTLLSALDRMSVARAQDKVLDDLTLGGFLSDAEAVEDKLCSECITQGDDSVETPLDASKPL